jgi:membrane protease YdiL (CAAX protease family)
VPELNASNAIITTPPKPTLRGLFLGDDGLRAGWSFLLFIAIFAILAVTGNKLIAYSHLLPPPQPHAAAHDMTPRISAIGEALGLICLLIAALVMSLIERRPFTRYGLNTRRMPADFALGLFWGLASLSLLIGTLLITHTIAFDGLALHGATALGFAAKWGLVFLLVGLMEEFMTRGYIQYTVSRGVAGIVRAMDAENRHTHAISFWIAAFMFSICLFMAGHLGNHGETVAGILAVGLAGAVFAFSLYRTGTLWWAIGFHSSWDWAQSYLYGTPDSATHAVGHLLNSHPAGSALLSGGTAGPEGSLFVIPTLLFAALVIHLTLPRRQYPLTPDQTSPAGDADPHAPFIAAPQR